MFEHLAKHRHIFVTGPQRSGTTITSAMIAKDTGHGLVLEEVYYSFDTRRLADICNTQENIVIQSPAILLHLPNLVRDDSLVVFMVRDINDILASQERIGWQWEKWELENLGLDENQGPSALRKREWWDEWKNAFPNILEVEYESLSAHSMWVEKERRREFGARQFVA